MAGSVAYPGIIHSLAPFQRLPAIAAAAGIFVAAFLTGAHWVDVGDSRCGGVYRPDIWWADGRCTGRMLLRTGGVVVLVSGGELLLGLVRRAPR